MVCGLLIWVLLCFARLLLYVGSCGAGGGGGACGGDARGG